MPTRFGSWMETRYVGYSKLKNNVRLLFWSGQSFEEEGLQVEGALKLLKPAIPPPIRSTSKI
jgi:hypothetical protein